MNKILTKTGFGRNGSFSFSSFELFGATIIVGNRFPFVGIPMMFNIPF